MNSGTFTTYAPRSLTLSDWSEKNKRRDQSPLITKRIENRCALPLGDQSLLADLASELALITHCKRMRALGQDSERLVSVPNGRRILIKMVYLWLICCFGYATKTARSRQRSARHLKTFEDKSLFNSSEWVERKRFIYVDNVCVNKIENKTKGDNGRCTGMSLSFWSEGQP